MANFLLDTNVIVDASSAKILECLKYSLFYVSYVVYKEEVLKQIPIINENEVNLINETSEELLLAKDYHTLNKNISFYDAINLAIAKTRKMILVTGDQQLIKKANKENVECVGVLKLIEVMINNELIDINGSIIALQNLKLDSKRRIPHSLVDLFIEKIKSRKVFAK